MDKSRKVKIAMLAATSLITAAGALAPVHAGQLDTAAFPVTVEAPVVSHAAEQAQHHDLEQSALGKRAALIAVALGAIGWLVKLLGPRKVLRVVERTAEATVKASGAAAKSLVRVARSPLRALAWIAGIVLFALTGVGLYDIEWIGGLVAGAALVGTAAFGSLKVKSAFQPALARVRRNNRPRRD